MAEHRGLQPAHRGVKIARPLHRAREPDRVGVPVARHRVESRATGEAEAQERRIAGRLQQEQAPADQVHQGDDPEEATQAKPLAAVEGAGDVLRDGSHLRLQHVADIDVNLV